MREFKKVLQANFIGTELEDLVDFEESQRLSKHIRNYEVMREVILKNITGDLICDAVVEYRQKSREIEEMLPHIEIKDFPNLIEKLRECYDKILEFEQSARH